jgi:hypothetical protein
MNVALGPALAHIGLLRFERADFPEQKLTRAQQKAACEINPQSPLQCSRTTPTTPPFFPVPFRQKASEVTLPAWTNSQNFRRS